MAVVTLCRLIGSARFHEMEIAFLGRKKFAYIFSAEYYYTVLMRFFFSNTGYRPIRNPSNIDFYLQCSWTYSNIIYSYIGVRIWTPPKDTCFLIRKIILSPVKQTDCWAHPPVSTYHCTRILPTSIHTYTAIIIQPSSAGNNMPGATATQKKSSIITRWSSSYVPSWYSWCTGIMAATSRTHTGYSGIDQDNTDQKAQLTAAAAEDGFRRCKERIYTLSHRFIQIAFLLHPRLPESYRSIVS